MGMRRRAWGVGALRKRWRGQVVGSNGGWPLWAVTLVVANGSGLGPLLIDGQNLTATRLTPVISAAVLEDANDELIMLVLGLLGDADKDVRALGLEQVRTDAKGAKATQQFAAQLPKMNAEGQVGLLGALADRGDKAARPVVLALLQSTNSSPVRAAAVKALGDLGEPTDTAVLMKYLVAEGDSAEELNLKAAARLGLSRLAGDEVSRVIAASLTNGSATGRVSLMEVLVTRRATSAVPALLTVATSDDATSRTAAMAALGQLASPADMAGLVAGVLRATAGAERESAEKCVAQVCFRVTEVSQRSTQLLEAWQRRSVAEQRLLLSCLGRVGGAKVREVLEQAIENREGTIHDAGLRAICNWPDATIAPRYLELLKADAHEDHRTLVLRALIRVAPLADERTPADRLAILGKCMQLSQRDAERQLVLARVSAVRTVESLRFVLPYVEQKSLAKSACLAVVELAHHRELRDANKAEFEKALDRVLAVSDDAVVKDRATRYKKGQTWTRPTKSSGEKS